MADQQGPNKDQFLFPVSKYYGKFTPGNLAFNANLQEFTQRVGYICALESGGKISSEEAYQQIKDLWHELKLSKKEFLDTPMTPPAEGFQGEG
jgi:hypothetical protein